MLGNITKKIFGTPNDRYLKNSKTILENINSLEGELEKLNDNELKQNTLKLREKFNSGESLESLLPLSFATVREASKRILGQRHYDVQMIGGIALHQGKISEMKTGEGKTLVSTLPAYLNALSGKGVHIVTVNDYLAKRDSKWMGKIYEFLGLNVGCVVPGINDEERKKHILENMLYMSEFNKKNVFISKQIFDIKNKYKLNIHHGDSLKLDTKKEAQKFFN